MPYADREKQLEYMRRYNKTYQKRRYVLEKEALIKRLGGKCAACGSTTDLEFDHISRGGKRFAITAKLHCKDLYDELEKCQLLCSKCHKKKTAVDLNYAVGIGSTRREKARFYRRKWYQEHKDEYNAKRRDRRKTQNALQKRSTGGGT